MVAVTLALGSQKVLANVEGNESNSGNSKAGKSSLESVGSGEVTLVSPSFAIEKRQYC